MPLFPRTPRALTILTLGVSLLSLSAGLAAPAPRSLSPDPGRSKDGLSESHASIRLDQIQVIGSHNSYHAGIAPARLALIAEEAPQLASLLDYRHASLTNQLDHGIRQIEFDLYADTQGGRFATPHRPGHTDERWPLSPREEAVMRQPGIKVMHIPDLDQHATCQPFTACLAEISQWSRAHPGHVPIFVILETEQHNDIPGTTPVEPFSRKTFDTLDTDIRSSFPAASLLTPDDLHRPDETLAHAVATRGWPDLEKSRGKVVFLLDQRADGPIYEKGHPGLRGRIAFPNVAPQQSDAPDAAFTELNDGPADAIPALVSRHWLVRVRADANTIEGRTGATGRRDALMASGAQLVSTDYPDSEPARWSGYHVGFPAGGAARCNPVTQPRFCRDDRLEPNGANHLVLSRLVLVMRHGIRSALNGQHPSLATLPASWPVWEGRAGDLTPRGARALSAAAHSLREWLNLNDLFSAAACPASGQIVIHANTEPRTIASADAFARGIAPACAVTVDHLPIAIADPLFSQQILWDGATDMTRLVAAMPDPNEAFSSQGNALTLLGTIMNCTQRLCPFLHEPSHIGLCHGRSGFILSGPINESSSYAEALELGFLDGKALPDHAGKPVDAAMIETLSGLHAAMLDTLVRPRPLASLTSRLLREAIIRDLTTPDGPRLKIYMGHDDTIAPLLGMLDINVRAPGYAQNEIPVGAALGFALYRNPSGRSIVRVLFLSQIPEAVRRDPDHASLLTSYPAVPACEMEDGSCEIRELTTALAP
ncbi:MULTISPECIES: Ca2+-dependent phosphoinositide-specific phospholipase C [Asaia]|uniref:Ca2+-dependent phosphoinositide-specific phospholipase C n=1 Tax=Asaia TaxID=91914 RepID=UPI002FC2C0E4